MDPVTITLSTISIISLIIVASILKYQQIKIENDYNLKLRTMAQQTNQAGVTEYQAIKTQQKEVNELSADLDNVKKSYVTKRAMSERVDTALANIDDANVGVLKFSKNNYVFDELTDKDGQKLKLDIPNKPGGGFNIVQGNKNLMSIDADSGHVNIPEKLNTNRIQLRNKWNISGDSKSNDDWLRLFDKDNKDFYGGIATAKTWTRDVSMMNNAYANKFTSYGGKGDSNWLEMNKKDGSLYFGADNSLRGIKSVGNRPFSIYNNDKQSINVNADSSVEMSKLTATDINANSIGRKTGDSDWFNINNNNATNPNSKGTAFYQGVAINQGGGLSVGEFKKMPEGQAYIRNGLKIRHNFGDWTSNSSLTTWAPINTPGASFGGPDQWSHLPWSDGNTYIRPGKINGTITFEKANNINSIASNIVLKGTNTSVMGENFTTNTKLLNMIGSNLTLSGSNITMKGQVSLTNNICLNGECLSSSDVTKIQNAIKPVDCKVSDWIPVGSCSKPCGGGTQLRLRSVIQPAMNDGAACPILSDTQPCNSNPCSVDCKVSEWSNWSICDKPCEGGKQTRNRKVIQEALYGGTNCPALTETQICNPQGCPVDCTVNDWSDWSTCDKPCGGGSKSRTRTVKTQPLNDGKICPVLSETQVCNQIICSTLDCQLSEWSPWSDCINGTQTRTRTIIKQASQGGAECPNLIETQPCKVDCQVGQWAAWGSCSINGIQTTTRKVIQESLNGGIACPALSMDQPCKIDCRVSDWTYGPCSSNGDMIRTRKIIQEPVNEGASCPALTETIPCKIDCKVSDWTMGTCGSDGKIIKTRTVLQKAMNGGTECPALTEAIPCKVDCVMNDWSDWSTCDKSCGGGLQKRTRTIKTQSLNDGTACQTTQETQSCNTQTCVTITATNSCTQGQCPTQLVSPTSSTKAVMQSDGNFVIYDSNGKAIWSTGTTNLTGTKAPYKQVLQPDGNLVIVDSLNKIIWTTVSSTTELFTQQTTVDNYNLTLQDNGTLVIVNTTTGEIKWSSATGKSIKPDITTSAPIPTNTCIGQCSDLISTNGLYKAVMQEDGNYVIYNTTNKTPIWATATTGITEATLPFKVVMRADGYLLITDNTNKTVWKPLWTGSIGVGPFKTVLQDNGEIVIMNGGGTIIWNSTSGKFSKLPSSSTAPTPTLVPTLVPTPVLTPTPTPTPTPVNCVMSDWTNGPCGSNGLMGRTRTILQPAVNGGLACPALSETSNCKVDCKVSEWVNGICTANGTMIKTRQIIQPAVNDGQACPVLTETSNCKIDCKVSEWMNGQCAPNGTMTRDRKILQQPVNGGTTCPTLLSEITPCKLDCEVSGWFNSPCDSNGMFTRTRTIMQKPLNGGLECPVLTETSNCKVDCKVGEWTNGPCAPNGTMIRTRTISQQSVNGGAVCPTTLTETIPCKVDCRVSDWTNGPCAPNGTMTRTRIITQQPYNGGLNCPVLSETSLCKVDCKVSDWTNGPCGSNGLMGRTRTILQPAVNGGLACPTLTETIPCKVDCMVSDWTNGSCGSNGMMTRTRTTIQQSLNDGATCPVLSENIPCKVNCQVSDWAAWSACANNSQNRTRTITQQPYNSGLACPVLSESQTCQIPGFSGAFKFTNVGVTGSIGPTLNQCITGYNNTSVTQFMNMATQGIQIIKLSPGTWKVITIGASSTKSGAPSVVETQFTLNDTTDVSIVVGQMGTGSGGSGGSFVFYNNATLPPQPKLNITTDNAPKTLKSYDENDTTLYSDTHTNRMINNLINAKKLYNVKNFTDAINSMGGFKNQLYIDALDTTRKNEILNYYNALNDLLTKQIPENTLIAAAGGAGGTGAASYAWAANASITANGVSGNKGINYPAPYNGALGAGGVGGTIGSGGKGYSYVPGGGYASSGGGGGGGWASDGSKGIGDGGFGYPSFVGGKNAGSGGFGGGGGGYFAGGGGGGYSGGGGGWYWIDAGTGGGGGSFGINNPKISLLPITSVPTHGSVTLQKI